MTIISKHINNTSKGNNNALDATLTLKHKNSIIIIRVVLFDDYESYTATVMDAVSNEIISTEDYEELLPAKNSKYGQWFYRLSKEMANSKT